ncbi:XRE family transcriptional regulator [Nitrospirillum sp. BR 11163]|uniref:helix-turn-helix domain-containing protein n=1 Tax=Nitrospirillum sp. BR 11163 TaxID=3104323 RepID=UPI002AFDF454|nr:XRE family transcriptional regulator [Nitrospirillum sp. BR 11163]MEA1674752.1 XRE family transcriptional regulator [Nitrospirillum sp. BR 11163]
MSDRMKKNATLGQLIGALRQRNGWTLKQMSDKVGIPLSTLAKVEGDKLSLSYDKLEQFTSRLGLSMAEFLAQGQGHGAAASDGPPVITGRRSLTSDSNSVRIHTGAYDYEYLCTDLRRKRMVPILTQVLAHTLDEFGDLVRHQGEEFIYVVDGTIEVHLEFYAPVTLRQGQGIYIDSMMGHAYLAKDCERALVLGVCSSDDGNLQGDLITLAENRRSVPPDGCPYAGEMLGCPGLGKAGTTWRCLKAC